MAVDDSTALSIAELAIYTVLVPMTFYLFFRHGIRSTLGYMYLFAFETLRLVSAGLQISAHSQHKTSSATGSIIASVGLSPLILALSGFIYELSSYSYYYYDADADAAPERGNAYHRHRRLLIVQEVLVHLGAYTGIALAASGASKLAKSSFYSSSTSSSSSSSSVTTTTSASDIEHAHTLQETGTILILVTWIGQVYLCARLCVTRGVLTPVSVSLGVACIFVGVRCVYGVVYAFDHSRSSPVNPVTGSFAVKVTLVVLVQLVVVVALLVVGFLTRDIARDHGVKRRWWRRGGRGGWYTTTSSGGPVEIDRGSAIPLRSPK
ncbi:hypothetical protein PV08_10175 [Exophiala spinifera]|uniref:DUF7702 domain-containing protein n=1 Tax=Exophiala spinifera TaxID=91928 RepID=A0A0D1Y7I6_9EURO|nr:uncharacterized protein PV08_10175 [Exophiala spinifera]KIW10876.1 hypothetical protein PV08_10175 [Exophiala spinifera]